MLTVCVTNMECLINKGSTLQNRYNLDVDHSAVYDYFKFSVAKLTRACRKTASRAGYVVKLFPWIII